MIDLKRAVALVLLKTFTLSINPEFISSHLNLVFSELPQ